MLKIIRPRRSVLYMPGSNPRALAKGKTLPAGGLILDLEDAVAPDAKRVARDAEAAAKGQGLVVVEGRRVENLHAAEAERTVALAAAIAALEAANAAKADAA